MIQTYSYERGLSDGFDGRAFRPDLHVCQIEYARGYTNGRELARRANNYPVSAKDQC
jgi:hypothetical protein